MKKVKSKNKIEKTRDIPRKNYITLFVIYVVCILAVVGMKILYRSYSEYKLNIPVLQGKISEVNINELDEYIAAHDDFYLYVGVASDTNCRNIEHELIRLLKLKNIKDETVYLNVSNLKDSNNVIYSKLSKYGDLNKTINYPLFIIFKDGKIFGKLDKVSNKIDIGDIEKLLDEYEVGIK